MDRRAPVGIRFEAVTKLYGAVAALDCVSLEVAPGEFLTLLGPSGSGKTTLLMVLAGFTRPTSGRIVVGGEDVTRTPPHRRDFGVVFQSYALFPHMTVAQNVAYPLRMRGRPRAEMARRVAEALALVRLEGFGDRRPDQLSGGQKQRVALARAIVFEPRVLLMDEPLSALDKKLREAMQIEIRRLHERLGITTIYVTHDQREALTLSDRVAVIDGGRIRQLDPPRLLYEEPRSRFVAEFVGESTILPVERRNGALFCAGRPLRTTRPLPPGEPLHLVLRPERVRLATSPPAEPVNTLAGTLEDLVFQGESLLAEIRLEAGELLAVRLPTGAELSDSIRRGGTVWAWFAPEDAVLVSETG
ncbi:MAG: ABC transporter ATP-binding protein [Geminicoccaceae bacterium]|jgi:putative spermidine/putrescine transport system ATP-binding protein